MRELNYTDFDPHAVLTMQLANQSAWKLNHNYINTEHILLAVCRNMTPEIEELLALIDLSVHRIIQELKRRVRRGRAPVASGKRSVRQDAKDVTKFACRIATQLGASTVATNHLFLAMLLVNRSTAADILASVGIVSYLKSEFHRGPFDFPDLA